MSRKEYEKKVSGGFGMDVGQEKVSQHYKFLNQGTALHIVIPTLRCNLKCKYCHSKSVPESKKGYDMDLKTAKKVLNFILQVPQKNVQIEFQGGEPLLNFEIIKYFIKAPKKGKDVKTSVVTNLLAMDDQKLEFLKKNKVNICTSLDGPKEIHDSSRGGYDRVVKWISKISSTYHIDALMVVTRSSLGFYKEIIDEYRRLGFNRIQLKPMTYLNRAIRNWDKISYIPEEFLDFYREAMDYILEINKEKKFVELISYYILRKILKKKTSNFLDLQSPCGACIGQLAYNYDGRIYSCDEGRNFDLFNIGTVEERYKDVITSNKVCSLVSSSINDSYICDNCAYKPYCGVCPVCSYSETGNIITNVANSSRCKIFKGIFDYLFENLEKNKKIFESWV